MTPLVRSQKFEEVRVSLGDFADDVAFKRPSQPPLPQREGLIAGVEVLPLTQNPDSRGHLTELSIFEKLREPLVHVYEVVAAAGSVRAWVYHKRQFDRLAYTNGKFDVVLFDLRPDSPTFGVLNEFRVGAENPCLLRLPPLVVHCVRNAGKEAAHFINMPTQVYDPAQPDKSRLPKDDPRIPYSFDER